MSKKVAFLDTLRKSLRNRNEHACYCMVSLLRVARHFDIESDAVLVGYAMDVQDEVQDAVFRRFPAGMDAAAFEQDMMTAAFVSIAQLSLGSSVDSLVQACLASSSPVSFKLAVVQGCCYFAKQSDRAKFEQVFAVSAPFMRGQFQVSQFYHLTRLLMYPTECIVRLWLPSRPSPLTMRVALRLGRRSLRARFLWPAIFYSS